MLNFKLKKMKKLISIFVLFISINVISQNNTEKTLNFPIFKETIVVCSVIDFRYPPIYKPEFLWYAIFETDNPPMTLNYTYSANGFTFPFYDNKNYTILVSLTENNFIRGSLTHNPILNATQLLKIRMTHYE